MMNPDGFFCSMQGYWLLRLRERSMVRTLVMPTWAEVIDVVQQLDGDQHDDASLEYVAGDRAEARLLLGGGENGRLVVALQQANDALPHHLGDPTANEKFVMQTVGGQETPLPGRFYTPLTMPLQATRTFFFQRRMDPDLTWETSGAAIRAAPDGFGGVMGQGANLSRERFSNQHGVKNWSSTQKSVLLKDRITLEARNVDRLHHRMLLLPQLPS
jgi:hypothetical protein